MMVKPDHLYASLTVSGFAFGRLQLPRSRTLEETLWQWPQRWRAAKPPRFRTSSALLPLFPTVSALMKKFKGTEVQGKQGSSLCHFIYISPVRHGSSSVWHVQEQDHACILSGELFLPKPHSSGCTEELMLIPTLQIFAEKRPFGKSQNGKKLQFYHIISF